jgi:periplasmic protein TonB
MPVPVRMSTVQPSAPRGSRFGLSRRAWWVVAAGFGVGFLLFLLLWLDQRNDSDFYRAEGGKVDSADGQVFEPLPAPMAGGDGSASGLSEAAEEALRNPPPPPPPVQAPRPVETPAARPIADAPQTARPSTALAPGSVPVPISKPAPDYPADALRNNETGTVVVRIEVGADGTPTDVTLARRSGSRSLDRAAIKAAKRWRFRPAQRDGQAIASAVEVPMAFSLDER